MTLLDPHVHRIDKCKLDFADTGNTETAQIDGFGYCHVGPELADFFVDDTT